MRFFIDTTPLPNGMHQVHRLDCTHLPSVLSRLYLGNFSSSFSALATARMVYSHADGCPICAGVPHRLNS